MSEEKIASALTLLRRSWPSSEVASGAAEDEVAHAGQEAAERASPGARPTSVASNSPSADAAQLLLAPARQAQEARAGLAALYGLVQLGFAELAVALPRQADDRGLVVVDGRLRQASPRSFDEVTLTCLIIEVSA